MARFVPRRRWIAALTVVGATWIGGAGVVARGGFTHVNSHPPPREANPQQILEHVYGGDFHADGLNFSNGAVTATRIDDADDMTWTQQVGSVRPLANFAKRKQSLGFFDDSGGETKTFFAAAGSKYDVAGGATTAGAQLNGSIRVGRYGNVERAFSSLPSENRDHLDHLISYRLSGPDIENPTYVLFWEDKWGPKSDFDFNDLVIEVAAKSDPLMIPLPPAAWSGLASLAAIGAVGTWKRTRRRIT